MFYLTLPTVSQVRRTLDRKGLDQNATFKVRYTDNAAPEGNDETYTLLVWSTVVGTGPDCDGTTGFERVIQFQVEGTRSVGECATYATNQQWRDCVAWHFGLNAGYHAGRQAGRQEEQKVWVDILVEKNKGVR